MIERKGIFPTCTKKKVATSWVKRSAGGITGASCVWERFGGQSARWQVGSGCDKMALLILWKLLEGILGNWR